jgi:hypothetical protein
VVKKYTIVKGLNKLEFCSLIFHEVGHLFDWYLSNGKQSKNKKVREKIARAIELSLNKKLED